MELLYRSLKQTLERRKMLSDSPGHAEVELDWTVMGLWMLGLMGLDQIGVANAADWSCARALRAVRQAMDRGRRRHAVLLLRRALRQSVHDSYQRKSPKKSRHWPHKKRSKPPGVPLARNATRAQVKLAKELVSPRLAA